MRRLLVAIAALVAGCDCGGESRTDAGLADAGPADAFVGDAFVEDGGPADAGAGDAGEGDAGDLDAGDLDAGADDAGPCDEGTDVECYSGPVETRGVGRCRTGDARCAGGTLTACSGEIVPSLETCNGLDDDCDGNTDEEVPTLPCGIGRCVRNDVCDPVDVFRCFADVPPAMRDDSCDGVDDDCDGATDEDCPCARVLPSGDDDAARTSAGATPFRTVQAAIDFAAGPGGPGHVCIAVAGPCGTVSVYDGDVRVAGGVAVEGGYDGTFARCPVSGVVLRPASTDGVRFVDAAERAELAGVSIERPAGEDVAAITVERSRDVRLARVRILAPVAGARVAHGVRVRDASEVTIVESTIVPGPASAESIGVSVEASRVRIDRSCANRADSGGRCLSLCSCVPGMLGASGGICAGEAPRAIGVLLRDSPRSVIHSSTVCAATGDEVLGVRLEGDAAGSIVYGNTVEATSGTVRAYGVSSEGCAGAAPWIVGNRAIVGSGAPSAPVNAGVSFAGDCHPRIEENDRIVGQIVAGMAANGVACESAGGVASRCVIEDNHIVGSEVETAEATGVLCENGSCARVERNDIRVIVARRATALTLRASAPLVAENEIDTCATMSAVAVRLEESSARIESNAITSRACGMESGAVHRAVEVVGRSRLSQPDLHGNLLDARGFAGPCRAHALVIDVSDAGDGAPAGRYRNDIFGAHLCEDRVLVSEANASSDPAALRHDFFDTRDGPTAYVDEGAARLASAAEVNALDAATYSGNLDGDPGLNAVFRLEAGSMCIDAGTPDDAAPRDIEGDPRSDGMPDIGPDEL